MAKVTKIKAKDPSDTKNAGGKTKKTDQSDAGEAHIVKRVKLDDKNSKQIKHNQAKKQKELAAEKAKLKNTERASKMPKPLRVLTAPFRALGRYLRDSWHEIRQVRWPDRRLTWKMTLSVIVYVVIFSVIIMLLDMFFSFIFNLILGE